MRAGRAAPIWCGRSAATSAGASDLPHYEALARGCATAARRAIHAAPLGRLFGRGSDRPVLRVEAPHACPLVQWRAGAIPCSSFCCRTQGTRSMSSSATSSTLSASEPRGRQRLARASEFAVRATRAAALPRAGLQPACRAVLSGEPKALRRGLGKHWATAMRYALNGSTCARHYTPLDAQVARAAEASTRTPALRRAVWAGRLGGGSLGDGRRHPFGWAYDAEGKRRRGARRST